ncbi:MAG: FAD binding domain-containing protein [Lutispora sp.]|nr:FAD binding domain-containing protein [Lutispora sp.]MDD4833859.1 FAD binding domain-containing protein [Lutispora sp.]
MNIKLYKPSTLNEAVELMGYNDGRIIAGGTDLIIELRNRNEKPSYLVDISSLSELKELRIEKEMISIGSAVTFTDIIENKYIKEKLPCFTDMAMMIGAVQIQNRATIGGNICNAAPAADSIPLLMSLGAKCIIISQRGIREVLLANFINDKGKVRLNSDEILKLIEFGSLGENEGCGFSKLGKRNAMSISTISCAVKIRLDEDIIDNICIYTGSLGIKATKEEKVESFLKGVIYNKQNIDKAADLLSQEVSERLGTRASMPYKRVAVKTVFKEACYSAAEKYGNDQLYMSGGSDI